MDVNIGTQIKEARKKAGMTQKELANILRKSERMIQKYESGDVNPSIDVLKEIASILKVSVNKLLGVEICFSKKIIQQLELPIIKKYGNDHFLEFLSSKLNIPYEDLVRTYRDNEECSMENQFKLFKYLKEIDLKSFLSFCIKNEEFILSSNNLKKLYSKSMIDNTENIINAYKTNKFEDIISNDRKHLLFSFKCLLTNYAIDWSTFTDDELMEIINSGSMFDFFPKIMKTYYNFFQSKKEALNINISPSNNKK